MQVSVAPVDPPRQTQIESSVTSERSVTSGLREEYQIAFHQEGLRGVWEAGSVGFWSVLWATVRGEVVGDKARKDCHTAVEKEDEAREAYPPIDISDNNQEKTR
mmetsp:Transcript_14772/g.27845  ORF Transcript_14772/g.27845 Transcript_14772/m.27845 type:complete len:104 (+) Transcript_14772:983-1294(+)